MRTYILVIMVTILGSIIYVTRNSKLYLRITYPLVTALLFSYTTLVMFSWCDYEKMYQCFI